MLPTDLRIVTGISFDLHGFSGTVPNGDFTGTAFQLMNKMWQIVKSNDLKNNGLNVWVYEPDNKIFAGVALANHPDTVFGLEHKMILLNKCALCKHIGPYNLISHTGDAMREELKSRSLRPGSPYIEVYGHWTKDEAALETDLYLALD